MHICSLTLRSSSNEWSSPNSITHALPFILSHFFSQIFKPHGKIHEYCTCLTDFGCYYAVHVMITWYIIINIFDFRFLGISVVRIMNFNFNLQHVIHSLSPHLPPFSSLVVSQYIHLHNSKSWSLPYNMNYINPFWLIFSLENEMHIFCNI